MEIHSELNLISKKISCLFLSSVFDKTKRLLISISGIPGSGKSSFSKYLKEFLYENIKSMNLSIKIIPFDGFHKYKKDLIEEQIKYRGRIDTFDLDLFKKKVFELKNIEYNTNKIYFPSFEHEIKDPKENDIEILEKDNIVILEGLYLSTKELFEIDYLFDIKIFIVSEIDDAMERVALRNYNAGISNSMEESIQIANYNDRANAEYIIKNSNFENAISIKYI